MSSDRRGQQDFDEAVGNPDDTDPGRQAQSTAESYRDLATSALDLVRAAGLEPARRCHRGILSPLRLPVPPRPRRWPA